MFNNLNALSSDSLERAVAATFVTKGYFVERNRKWLVDMPSGGNKDICEIDIIPRNFSPDLEEVTTVECKGGGTFEDVFKFGGVIQFIKPDNAVMVCSNPDQFDLMQQTAMANNIILKQTEHFIKENITTNEEINLFKKWLFIFEIEDALLIKSHIERLLGTRFTDEQKRAYGEIRKFYTFLSGRVWKIQNPIEQANQIIELNNIFKDFIRNIARIQKLRYHTTEQAMNHNILCETAANIVVTNRILYLVSALRCAIALNQELDEDYFRANVKDQIFFKTSLFIRDNIEVACGIPRFINYFVYYFGGIINHFDSDEDEIGKMTILLNTDRDTILKYIDMCQQLFEIIYPGGTANWGIIDNQGRFIFLNVPPIIRAIGIKNKAEEGIDIDLLYPESYQWLDHLNKFNTN